MGKLLANKRATRILLIVLICAAVLLAAFLIVFTASEDRDDKETEESSVEYDTMAYITIDNSVTYAEDLFDCKVDDAKDTAAVATLLETMGVDSVLGEYSVNIANDDDGEVLSFETGLNVNDSGEEILNDNMRKISDQLLALIPSIDKVEWKYDLNAADNGDEDSSKVSSWSEDDAAGDLGNDIRAYGYSSGSVHELLMALSQEAS